MITAYLVIWLQVDTPSTLSSLNTYIVLNPNFSKSLPENFSDSEEMVSTNIEGSSALSLLAHIGINGPLPNTEGLSSSHQPWAMGQGREGKPISIVLCPCNDFKLIAWNQPWWGKCVHHGNWQYYKSKLFWGQGVQNTSVITVIDYRFPQKFAWLPLFPWHYYFTSFRILFLLLIT